MAENGRFHRDRQIPGRFEAALYGLNLNRCACAVTRETGITGRKKQAEQLPMQARQSVQREEPSYSME